MRRTLTVGLRAALTLLAGTAPVLAQPSISSVTPASGPLGGGTTVNLSGPLVGTATLVQIGGTVAPIDLVQTENLCGELQVPENCLVVTTPAASVAGAKDVVVTTPSGNATKAGGFTYNFVSSMKEQNRTTTGALATGGGTYEPAFSADGRYLAFRTDWNLNTGNQLPQDSNFNTITDVLVRDRAATNSLIRINVATDGQPPTGPSGRPRISADGRYVAFWSEAENLVANDTNQRRDIFVRDRDADGNGTFDESCANCTSTRRVSVSSQGVQADGDSGSELDLSPDGRWVVFSSDATNLVAGDTNQLRDIFLRDRDADGNGTFDEACANCTSTRRVSVSSAGVQANGASRAPGISRHGERVVFDSDASNLVQGDNGAFRDVFVFERSTGTVTRLSVTAAGQQGDGPSEKPSIDDEGLTIAFQTKATNLAPDVQTAGPWQVVVYSWRLASGQVGQAASPGRVQESVIDIAEALRRLLSGSQGGTAGQQPGNGDSQDVEVCGSGDCAGYATGASNLNQQVDPDTNNQTDTVVQRIEQQPTAAERVSKDDNGNQVDASSSRVAVDESGTVAAVQSFGQLVTSVEATGASNVFVSGVSIIVSRISPNSAFSTVADQVAIVGGGFQSGVSVKLGTIPMVTNFDTATSIRFQFPAGSVPAGGYDVTVTNPSGESRRVAAAFTVFGVPTVTGVTPTSGPTAGGTPITVTGTEFVAGQTSVTVGGAAATNVQVTSKTSLTAVTPAGSAGAKAVAVTTPAGVGTRSDAFTYVAATFGLTVTGAGAGAGSIASQAGLSPAIACTSTGGTTSGTCGATYSQGTVVTLTATATAGSTFTGWTGACAGTGTCQVTMTATRQVTATFAVAAPQTLTVTGSGAGSGQVSSQPGLAPAIACTSTAGTMSGTCSATYPSGTVVTLTAAASAGSTFTGWGGACAGTGACQVTITAGQQVTATFLPATVQTFPVTVTGTGNGSGSVASQAGLAPAIACTITNGAASGTCSATYPQGTLVTLTAAAMTGSSFTGWGGACSGTGACSVAVNAATAVSASFSALTQYLAEGATGDFFYTRVGLANLSPTETASAELRFQRSDGVEIPVTVSIPPRQTRKVTANFVPGLENAEFSTVIQSSIPLAVQRTMWWDKARGYGSHNETAVEAPATAWYLAEGSTNAGFQLFYLVQNPGTSPANIAVRFLLPSGSPLVKNYTVNPTSRFNIWANTIPELASTDVSAVITSTNGVPIIVERAMYLNSQGLLFGAGHESAGVTEPGTSWFLAEGATGPYFDLFVLMANPNATPARVTATYLLPGGSTVEKSYAVNPQSRFTAWVDFEDARLADTAVSTTVVSDVPILVERAMWWPGSLATWHEAHNSFGARRTGTLWGVGEGVINGPPANGETYMLIANPTPNPARVAVSVLFDDGTPEVTREFRVAGTSRFNVDIRAEFPEAINKSFGVAVESLPRSGADCTFLGAILGVDCSPTPIVVEQAVYNDANNVDWAAGTNSLATRFR